MDHVYEVNMHGYLFTYLVNLNTRRVEWMSKDDNNVDKQWCITTILAN